LADTIDINAESTQIKLHWESQPSVNLTLHLPGLFNAYNLLAASAAVYWLKLPLSQIERGLSRYTSIFGRAEKRFIDNKPVMILLIKNPIGASEVLKVTATDPNARLVIMINDNYADGRDISWLWDAPFELLRQASRPIVVSGHRAEDMALRLRYAEVPSDLIQVEPNIMSAFYHSVREAKPGETVYVLPTYTALLQLSQAIGSR
jgi:UDP-N-acetylmuramyl tripeptide synthase